MKTLDMTMLAGRDVRLVLIFDRSENVGSLTVAHWTLVSWMPLSLDQVRRIILDQDVSFKLVDKRQSQFTFEVTSSTDSSG